MRWTSRIAFGAIGAIGFLVLSLFPDSGTPPSVAQAETSKSVLQSADTETECRCWNHMDLDGDGFPTALDIQALVDVLFAGRTDIQDPDCVRTRSDIDCDDFTTVLDLHFLVGYMFEGGFPPCNPCPSRE